jgi:hypothetical protein
VPDDFIIESGSKLAPSIGAQVSTLAGYKRAKRASEAYSWPEFFTFAFLFCVMIEKTKNPQYTIS